MLEITRALVITARGWPVAVLTMLGELDIDTVTTLRAVVAQVLADGIYRIVLDLANLVFCDAAGLGALVTAQGKCLSGDGWMRLARPTPRFRWLVELTDLSDAMTGYGTLEQALSRPDPS